MSSSSCRQRIRIGEREFQKVFWIVFTRNQSVNSEHRTRLRIRSFQLLIFDSMPFLHERCQSNDFHFNVILCLFLLIITCDLFTAVHRLISFSLSQFTVRTTGNLMLFRYLEFLYFEIKIKWIQYLWKPLTLLFVSIYSATYICIYTRS